MILLPKLLFVVINLRAAVIDQPLKPFGWKNQIIANVATLADVVQTIKRPSVAVSLMDAARFKGNSDLIFGSLVDHLPSAAARAQFMNR